ncbi:hypothetical protein D3C87_1891910 [compost metagenome]
MQIEVAIEVCSTDKRVNGFKPCPDGLLLILSEMRIKKENCLYIGDRWELDGVCAERAGISFLFADKLIAVKDFYLKLSAELNCKRN